jgi:signal peptidase I
VSKKRKPLIAALFSLLAPGLGQLYNGQLNKAVITFVSMLLMPVMALLLKLSFWVIPLLLIMIIAVYAFAVLDAFIMARRLKTYELKPFNKTYVYITIVIITLGISQFVDLKSFVGIRAFIVDGPAMAETLLQNDRIIVDTRVKQYKAGDIVVYQKDERKYVHRIVAVAGDTIEVRDSQLLINQEIMHEPYVSNREYFEAVDPTTVPLGSYYTMGDNRSNSIDSRYLGALSSEEIIGKVLYCYFSDDAARIGKQL